MVDVLHNDVQAEVGSLLCATKELSVIGERATLLTKWLTISVRTKINGEVLDFFRNLLDKVSIYLDDSPAEVLLTLIVLKLNWVL